MSDTARQWLRACSLIVADQQGNGIELAGPDQPQVLRIRFNVEYWISGTPANIRARVYNLSDNTVNQIRAFARKDPPDFDSLKTATSARVVLKAGYQNNFGLVFTGNIYQMRVGRENATDTYIDLMAADGDQAHNYAWMNESLDKGYTAERVYQRCGASMQDFQVTPGPPPDGLDTSPSPRGKVMFGPTRDHLRDFAEQNTCTWNIMGGQLQSLPKFAARPGDAVVINRTTGQIGVPRQTENGIEVTCLLNPAIRWGTKIKLDNAEVAQLTQGGTVPNAAGPVSPSISAAKNYVPQLNADGQYICLSVKHIGDTRGQEWYSEIVCLSSDPSAPIPQARPAGFLPPGVLGGTRAG